MYKPEIVLRATETLKNQIKSDWEKWKEFKLKTKKEFGEKIGKDESTIKNYQKTTIQKIFLADT